MPTGYTAGLCERDMSFEEFVWRCARAFGALVSMRDESMDAPIPERFEPSTYYTDQLKELRAELTRLESLTEEEWAAERDRNNRNLLQQHLDHVAKKNIIASRLSAMLAKVRRWQPPTDEHKGLKQFLVDQLESTMRYDGTPSDFYSRQISTGDLSVWRQECLNKLSNDIEYHIREQRQEVERVEKRNRWLAALRDSLQP